MSDYTVTIKVANGRIRSAMRNAGFKTVAELCRQAGLSQTEVGRLLNLKSAPLDQEGNWRSMVLKLADALGVMPDDLFSSAQRTMAVTKNFVTKFVSEDEVHRIAAAEMNAARLEFLQDNAALQELEEEDKVSLCESMMAEVLTSRQASVLRARMNGESLEDVGSRLDVSRERVRQIENKAIRKLRQAASGKLKELI